VKVRLGISMGDPNGIGPEITLKAVQHFQGSSDLELIPIGDAALLKDQAKRLVIPLPGTVLSSSIPFPTASPGEVSAEAGRASASWVDRGIQACLQQELHGLVTAPIHKEAWSRAGIPFPGHTELLAERCGTDRFGMMLMGKGLRVMLATRHIPLSQVPERVTESEIRLAVELLREGLPLLGIPSPRIAVCGLNPHAGDGGAIGDEEIEWIGPLIQTLQEEGAPVTGPHPADTVFHQAVHQGAFDAVVALYHDQGLAPLKLWAFDEGVNLTLGLPIVRTSPDHGTAFGIAGKGIAKPDSLIAAIHAAADIARKESPWNAPA